MISLLIRKLERLGPLSQQERSVLEQLPLDVRQVEADRDLAREGETLSHCMILLEGLACRHKVIEGGRRQIVSFHMPGDIVDLNSVLLGRMDHNISTLTPVKAAAIPHATLLDWMRRLPNLVHLLWRDTLIDASVFREWVVNVGRRSAYARVAHLLCELATRMHAAGLTHDHASPLPVTQLELADATGLSPVHVNRTVQELRSDGLIRHSDGGLAVLDWEGLKQAAGFDPAYLHQLAA